MNEAETRAELIDPKLKASGWGIVEGSRVLREYTITAGRIQNGGERGMREIADYVLEYKGIKLAVVEAKSEELEVGEGIMQAKKYAEKLKLETTYATNGREIYQINMKTGKEELVEKFPTPDELWTKNYPNDTHTDRVNEWREKFASVPFDDKSGSWKMRYYQEIAIRNVLEAIAKGKNRILLTLATGTGKTAIAFQIAWKLFQTRWTVQQTHRPPGNEPIVARRPRILFLADRNILADQAYNSFSSFPDDVLKRIRPNEVSKSGQVPTNGSIFFTIFQTFMSGRDDKGNPKPYFGQYPSDFFDLIIVDECHRGGAADESSWRAILEYFNTAVQLGLTATPKRSENVDTYKYFGEPVFMYSLKDGINDGFLTPFKVKRIQSTIDEYIYSSDDDVLEGEVIEGKIYKEADFNTNIEIKEREVFRVREYLKDANPNEKAIIFCANQRHAALIRDIVNQNKTSSHPNYCVRVTANDGEEGERFLREFQDNEKNIPTILTTSHKLSTGVDARNIRNIVLLRPINSMIEFKQIIGRGTRLFEGKSFFTIYDFVNASQHFADPEWDGEPLEPDTTQVNEPMGQYITRPLANSSESEETHTRQIVKIKLRDGKEREIQSMSWVSFWSPDGKPLTLNEFLDRLLAKSQNEIKDVEELQNLWSNPDTRKTLLERFEAAGFNKNDLNTLLKLIQKDESDIFDLLLYVTSSKYNPISREERVAKAKDDICANLSNPQKEFIQFVLEKYIEHGFEELDPDKLHILLTNKYQSLTDAHQVLGDTSEIRCLFIEFQKRLYFVDN